MGPAGPAGAEPGIGRHCRFLQYDYIGVGGSSAKTDPFSMLDLADELAELLDALSVESVHLPGIIISNTLNS